MTAHFDTCQAGLVLVFALPFSITAKATAAAVLQDACARRNIPVVAAPVTGASSVTLHTAAFDIVLDHRPGPGQAARLVLTISRLPNAEPIADDVMHGHLAALCGKLMHQFPCSTLQWLSDSMELPADRFLAETDPVKPRRVKPQRKPRTPAPAAMAQIITMPLANAA